MNVIHSKWYGWIPTNRGKLKFDFIKLHEELLKNSNNVITEQSENVVKFSNVSISYLSDSYSHKFLIKQTEVIEIPGSADFFFEKRNDGIYGNILINYAVGYEISSKFFCKFNGIIEFEDIHYSYDQADSHIENIKTLFYVLIKTIIHGDAHHHQKIDIALSITDEKFNPSVISSSLLDYIKLVERNIKLSKSCISLLRSENLALEMEGYLSYFKTFTLLFKNKKVLKDYEFAKCIVNSLKSTVAKRKNKESYTSGLLTMGITFVGLFISINILINSFGLTQENNISSALKNYDRFDSFVISFFILLCTFYYFMECKINTCLYYKYYHIYEVVHLIQNSSIENLSLLGQFIKLLPVCIFLGLLFYFIEDIIKLMHLLFIT